MYTNINSSHVQFYKELFWYGTMVVWAVWAFQGTLINLEDPNLKEPSK